MESIFFAHLLNGVLMIGLPVGLWIILARRFGAGGRLFFIGGTTFVLAQAAHIPFNIALNRLFQQGILPLPPESWLLLFNAVLVGLSAGIFEEFARYGMYRWWVKEARSWRAGVMLGAGHGGAEAILLGALVGLTFIQMAVFRNADLSGIVAAEQVELARQSIAEYWRLPWYEALLGAVERAFTIPAHIAFSLLVLQTFIRRQARWLWLAVLWHAALDAIAVLTFATWGAYLAEAAIGLTALVNIGIVIALWKPEPVVLTTAEPPLQQPLSAAEMVPVEETPESLDKSRYL